MRHEMRLHNEPFMAFLNGSKKIEMRLNDEKRQLICVGDEILFSNRKTGEEMVVLVKRLHYFPTFEELFSSFSPELLGYSSGEVLNSKDMEQYYSKEEQEKYGVVGIEVEIQK